MILSEKIPEEAEGKAVAGRKTRGSAQSPHQRGCTGSLGGSSPRTGEVFPLEGAAWSTAPLRSPPPAVTRVHAGKRTLNCLLLHYKRFVCPVGAMGSIFKAKQPSSYPLWQPGPSPCRKPQDRSVQMDVDPSSSLLTLIYSFG